MSMPSLRALVSRIYCTDTHVYECRQCGMTVPDEDATCPYCGQTEVLVYEIP